MNRRTRRMRWLAGGVLAATVLLVLVYTWMAFRPTGFEREFAPYREEAEVQNQRRASPVRENVRRAVPGNANGPVDDPPREMTFSSIVIELVREASRFNTSAASGVRYQLASGWAYNEVAQLRTTVLRDQYGISKNLEGVHAHETMHLFDMSSLYTTAWPYLAGFSADDWSEPQLEELMQLIDWSEELLYDTVLLDDGHYSTLIREHHSYWAHPFAAYAQPPILRAHFRGDRQRAGEMLRRYCLYVVALNNALAGEQWQMCPMPDFIGLLLLLGDLGGLDADTLRDIDAILEDAILRPEDWDTHRRALIARRAADMKQAARTLPSSGSTWTHFMNGKLEMAFNRFYMPVYDKTVERHALAVLSGNPNEMGQSSMRLEMSFRLLNRHASSIFETVTDLHPVMAGDWPVPDDRWFDQPVDLINDAVYMARFVTACQIFRIEHGDFPERFDELVPAYLPEDFSEIAGGVYIVEPLPERSYFLTPWPVTADAVTSALEEYQIAHGASAKTMADIEPYLESDEARKLARERLIVRPGRTAFMRLSHPHLSVAFETTRGYPPFYNPGAVRRQPEELVRVLAFVSLAPELRDYIEFFLGDPATRDDRLKAALSGKAGEN